MGEDSRNAEVGELDQESFDLEVITWKISNVSSILFAVDYAVHSPPFSFAGASWILKIFFYGQTKCNSKGYIDVVIKRLHSEIEVHDSSFKMYVKNIFDKELKPRNKHFSFSSNHTKMCIVKLMENFQERPDKWEIVPKDTFTLVCELQNKKNITETKSAEQLSGLNVRNPKVGEIEKVSYQIETVKWTIRNASTLPSPEDCQVQGPLFSFAAASWTLKIYPYFRLQHLNKQCFYVALVRLHSQISDHHVLMNICFEDSITKAQEEITRSCIFNSNHMHGDLIGFSVREEQINAPHDTFTLFCKLRAKRNAASASDSQVKLAESIGDLGDNFKSGCTVGLHKNKILRDLKELFLKQEDCDVVISVKGKEFPAHRAILKARSPVFESAFRHDMKEKATGVLDIEDCDSTKFSDFLSFLYCGEIENLSVENVFDLFTTADKYEVLDLKLLCMEFIKDNLTIDTFCDTIVLALKYSDAELLKLSTDFFAKNLHKIIVTVKWQSFITENPIQGNELMIKALLPDNN